MEMLQPALMVTFWGCFALVAYAYIGYPLLIAGLARLFGVKERSPVVAEEGLPVVSLLIAAYNEEAEIEKRIQTTLMTDYPREKLEIVIASDGSTDATAEIARQYAHRGVRLLDYSERRGKSAVLNSAFGVVQGEIVLLSDANTRMDPQAVREMVRWFTDPQVGVVCGRLILTDPETGHNVDSLYWKYETFLKKREARLGGLLGANGAIYAIRKELYSPIPNDTIIDDFVLPLQARLRTGCSIIYESKAVAYEETPKDIRAEFRRRSRIGAGGFQSISMLWRLLHPRQGWTAFTFFSHKILRWSCPFFFLALLVSNLLLLGRPTFRWALAAQVGFYALSALASFIPPRVRCLKLLRLPTMFSSMNAALLVGFFRWLGGSQKGTWAPTPRLAETGGGA